MFSAEILPGVHYEDIVRVACEGLTFKASAERLGYSMSHLRRVLKRRGLLHWFPRDNYDNARPRKVSRRRLLYYARQGMTMRDTAQAIGYEYSWLTRRVHEYGIRDRFPAAGGESSWVARRGYCV